MAKASGKKTPTKIESTAHQDKRKNIPTEELRNFVAEDEKSPKALLYPRDPSLDPQLVWKGKDEQDASDLEVPAVPIYIQETIHPRALIENLRETAAAGEQEPELTLFDQISEIEDFEKRVEFYQHDDKWTNRMILGDSLMVMASLAEKEGLKGKVQMIYLDPPYGIEFGSNWQVTTRKRDVGGAASDVTRQPEQIKAFRDTWELGIHTYLTYLRDRLVIARDLLTETGSIFVQIGDANVHLVRCVLDEVFGSRNALNTIIFQKTSSEDTAGLPNVADYLLWYAKDASQTKQRQLLVGKIPGGEGAKQYVYKMSPAGDVVKMSADELAHPSSLDRGWRVCRKGFPLTSQHYSPTRTVEFHFEGRAYHPGNNRQWSLDPETELPRLVEMGRVYSTGRSLNGIVCLDEMPTTSMGNVWTDTGTGSFTGSQVYIVQTSEKVIQRCILLATDPGDLILDPTCGSGTTAYAAEWWGRRWIAVDTSRVALALARTRLMSSKYPYYFLSDSQEGAEKQAQASRALPAQKPFGSDIRKGFVYKEAPHRPLSDIARGTPGSSKMLYDQPFEDKSRLRVTGPFTVESLSPHRKLDPSVEERPVAEWTDVQADGGQFEQVIIDNLKAAGVQNTIKGEKLTFDRLEPYAGRGWIQAEGEFTDSDNKVQRVAVSIGPEHGTVGAEHVKQAAKEAVQGVGFDILVICGFAFDPAVSEEAKKFGALTVLPTRMNPDLAMGGDLLKKTRSGNLFMIFGEPDLTIKDEGDGMLSVELFGLDVYDPTTGEIRPRSTDDIACWFIDTYYNGEAFFVRHAYFTGADKPYEKLKKALRAEIDEEAWASLYSTKSRPFAKPSTGQIAVKVINHYGDEVLKVYEVQQQSEL